MKVREKIVGKSLGYVGTIEFKGHEHDTSKDHDAEIDLPNPRNMLEFVRWIEITKKKLTAYAPLPRSIWR
jgi:hypothetical protein